MCPDDYVGCEVLKPRLAKFLKGLPAGTPVVAFFNGLGQTYDTEQDVRAYWRDAGVSRKQLEQVRFVEKTYGFFRSWMDTDVDEDDIVSAARLMYSSYIWDSRDLELDVLAKVAPSAVDKPDCILIPEIAMTFIPSLGAELWHTAGDSRTACLLEIELPLNAMDIPYVQDTRFVY